MTGVGLRGRKIVVLGASSGIGRAFAVRAAKAGADVLMTARREERLEQARTEAGAGTVVRVDVSSPDDCRRLADEAARALGTVDVVLCTVGSAPLRRIEETTVDEWQSTFRTNVIGFNAALTALLPQLRDGALVMAMSSESVQLPRWAMAAYTASKAALEASLRAWRVEHPRVRFGTVVVGATFPTEFGDGFDGELLGAALDVWTRHGRNQEAFMDPDEVAETLLGIVTSVLPYPGVGMEEIVLRSPSPIVGSTDLMPL